MTVTEAQAEMQAIGARLERAYPETNTGVSLTVRPLLDKVVSGIRPTLVALLAMVTFVLLIACANVANTLLARASGRQKEIALRTAIGASRARVVRQLLTESLLLAGVGAIAGLALALLGVEWLLGVLPPGSLPRQQDVSFDVRVFMAAPITPILAGVAAGLAPALQLLKPGVALRWCLSPSPWWPPGYPPACRPSGSDHSAAAGLASVRRPRVLPNVQR